MTKEKYVLLVEDNHDDVLLTQIAFRRAHLENALVVVSDGVEAVDFIINRKRNKNQPSEQPTFILLDLKLPFINGIQVLEQIRSNIDTRDIPVVVLTSSLEPHDQYACRRLGISEYLQKPTDLSVFVDIIKKFKSLWLD